jgi:hypothetical protein
MKTKLRWVLKIAVVATVLKLISNQVEHGFGERPCDSSMEARNRGTLVALVAIEPSEYAWNNRRIAFTDAWIEEATQVEYFLVWFYSYKRTGSKFLCFKAEDRAGLAQVGDPWPMFLVEGGDISFGAVFSARLPVLLWCEFDDRIRLPTKISAVSSWHDPRANDLVLKLKE